MYLDKRSRSHPSRWQKRYVIFDGQIFTYASDKQKEPSLTARVEQITSIERGTVENGMSTFIIKIKEQEELVFGHRDNQKIAKWINAVSRELNRDWTSRIKKCISSDAVKDSEDSAKTSQSITSMPQSNVSAFSLQQSHAGSLGGSNLSHAMSSSNLINSYPKPNVHFSTTSIADQPMTQSMQSMTNLHQRLRSETKSDVAQLKDSMAASGIMRQFKTNPFVIKQMLNHRAGSESGLSGNPMNAVINPTAFPPQTQKKSSLTRTDSVSSMQSKENVTKSKEEIELARNLASLEMLANVGSKTNDNTPSRVLTRMRPGVSSEAISEQRVHDISRKMTEKGFKSVESVQNVSEELLETPTKGPKSIYIQPKLSDALQAIETKLDNAPFKSILGQLAEYKADPSKLNREFLTPLRVIVKLCDEYIDFLSGNATIKEDSNIPSELRKTRLLLCSMTSSSIKIAKSQFDPNVNNPERTREMLSEMETEVKSLKSFLGLIRNSIIISN